MTHEKRNLQVVRATGTPRAPSTPPLSMAQWAAVEAGALVTIEDAAKSAERDYPTGFPYAFVPPPLRAVYGNLKIEMDAYGLQDEPMRAIALQYYWLGLVMASVTLDPGWWTAINTTVARLARKEKTDGRRDRRDRGRDRPRAARRTQGRARASGHPEPVTR
jgi:hypothetical protein